MLRGKKFIYFSNFHISTIIFRKLRSLIIKSCTQQAILGKLALWNKLRTLGFQCHRWSSLSSNHELGVSNHIDTSSCTLELSTPWMGQHSNIGKLWQYVIKPSIKHVNMGNHSVRKHLGRQRVPAIFSIVATDVYLFPSFGTKSRDFDMVFIYFTHDITWTFFLTVFVFISSYLEAWQVILMLLEVIGAY